MNRFRSMCAILAALTATPALADAPDTIHVDFAYYNPVSLVLKDKHWDRGCRRPADQGRMGPERRQQQGARISALAQPGSGLERRIGRPARPRQRQSDQDRLYLLEAGMDRARHPRRHADPQRGRSQGQARGRDRRDRSGDLSCCAHWPAPASPATTSPSSRCSMPTGGWRSTTAMSMPGRASTRSWRRRNSKTTTGCSSAIPTSTLTACSTCVKASWPITPISWRR